ncbi:phage replisome organizer N-terminal domain-containing protein [Enterococcus faecium]|uniref:phage replisome organizer N-terminal domain-containing protein n=1 Tax=Enterococcus faecium TaxID=1352 RepID=UPI000BF1E5C9|nr:phage replisome organizer N-terminal domain-containing protein [Enterococcus faecium]PEH48080.1 phage replisome organizer [Enterococcus faecium]
MAEISWIKLSTGLPDNKKIKRIRKMPDGDKVILFWVFLLARAGEVNRRGGLFLTETLPYSEEDLAADFDFTVEFVRFALLTLEKYSMVTRYEEIFFIKNWEEYQSIEGLEKIREQNRLRQAKFRKKQKQLSLDNVMDNVTSNVTVTQSNGTDKEVDREIEKEDEEDIGVYEFIQKSWGKSPTGLLQGALGPMIKAWGADMILFAFKLAFENNVEMPGLKKYVEAILNSWSNQGIKTMESAEKAQEAFKSKKKQNYLPKRQNNVRREKLPDWVNKPQGEKALDPDKKAELEARFAAYQAKKEALLENE